MFYQGWKVHFPRRRTSHPISLDGGWESAARKRFWDLGNVHIDFRHSVFHFQSKVRRSKGRIADISNFKKDSLALFSQHSFDDSRSDVMDSFATPYLFHLFLRCHSAPGEEFSDRWHLEDLAVVMAIPQPCKKQMLRDAMRSQAFLLIFLK